MQHNSSLLNLPGRTKSIGGKDTVKSPACAISDVEPVNFIAGWLPLPGCVDHSEGCATRNARPSRAPWWVTAPAVTSRLSITVADMTAVQKPRDRSRSLLEVLDCRVREPLLRLCPSIPKVGTASSKVYLSATTTVSYVSRSIVGSHTTVVPITSLCRAGLINSPSTGQCTLQV